MSTENYGEPWVVLPWLDGTAIIDTASRRRIAGVVKEADARDIVLWRSATAGVPSEELAEMPYTRLKDFHNESLLDQERDRKEIEELKRDRDDFAAVIEGLRRHLKAGAAIRASAHEDKILHRIGPNQWYGGLTITYDPPLNQSIGEPTALAATGSGSKEGSCE